MGYRLHVAIIEKDKIDALRTCTSLSDVEHIYNKYRWHYKKDKDYEDVYFPVYELDYLASHELGKDYECYIDAFYDVKKRVFENKDVDDYFEEYNFEYGGQEMLESIIEDYRLKISNYFEGLLYPSKNRFYLYDDAEDLEEVSRSLVFDEIKRKLTTWKSAYPPYNLNKQQDWLVSSWLYEYAIFDLVRMYKMFDPEKHYVVYYGW